MDCAQPRGEPTFRSLTARLSDRRLSVASARLGGAFRQLVTGLLARVLWAAAGTASIAACTSLPTRVAQSAAPQAVASSPLFPVQAADATWGSATAPVTIVAFIDLECPFCARVHPTLRELQRTYGPEQLRVVFKHAPLPFHQQGIPAARAAHVVFEQRGVEALIEFMGDLFQSPQLGDAVIRSAAHRQGVNLGNVPIAAWQRADEVLRKDQELGTRLGVNGVPAFFINGASLVGAVPAEEFAVLIEHELAAATELQRTGTAAIDVFAKRSQVNYQAPVEGPAAAPEPAYVVAKDGSPAIGAQNPWVTIVEFVDFECAFCKRVHPVMQQLLREYPDKVQWVLKQNPLPFHKQAVPAAVLSLEVFRQRGAAAFFAAAEELAQAEALSPALFSKIAAEHRLDAEQLRKAYAAGADDPSIVADQDQAADLDANGTPHFFINGQRVAGTRPIEEFRALVESELSKVTALLATAPPQTNPSQSVYAALQSTAAAPPGLARVEAPALDAGTPRLGPKEAPVTVQIFSDFECTFCRRVMFTMRELRDRYPGQVQFAWRQLPLSFHRHAGQAAATSVVVHKQMGDAAFWGLVDRMFGLGNAGLSEPSAPSPLDEPEVLSLETLTRYAAEVGADTARVTAGVEAGDHTERIASDQRLAAQLGISGTPAILVNGYLVTGAQPLRRFDRLVRLSLQK